MFYKTFTSPIDSPIDCPQSGRLKRTFEELQLLALKHWLHISPHASSGPFVQTLCKLMQIHACTGQHKKALNFTSCSTLLLWRSYNTCEAIQTHKWFSFIDPMHFPLQTPLSRDLNRGGGNQRKAVSVLFCFLLRAFYHIHLCYFGCLPLSLLHWLNSL